MKDLINTIFLDISTRCGGKAFFGSQAILAACNDDVAKINFVELDMISRKLFLSER